MERIPVQEQERLVHPQVRLPLEVEASFEYPVISFIRRHQQSSTSPSPEDPTKTEEQRQQQLQQEQKRQQYLQIQHAISQESTAPLTSSPPPHPSSEAVVPPPHTFNLPSSTTQLPPTTQTHSSTPSVNLHELQLESQ